MTVAGQHAIGRRPAAVLIAGADVLGRMASQDLYGEHKLAVEEAHVPAALLTPGLARDGQIRFDMSPSSSAILPVERCARVLDAFVLTRLISLYGPPCSVDDLRDACLEVGRRLAAAMCGG